MIYYIYNQDELLGFVYNNATYYYHKNILRDVIGILDSNYQEIVTYSYDAYGSIINNIDNSGINIGEINPFRYRSYYYDIETNLYYLNSRYYNPSTGRFINADGIIAANQDILSNNLYTYVSNNYTNMTDKTGNYINRMIRIENFTKTIATPIEMFLKSIFRSKNDNVKLDLVTKTSLAKAISTNKEYNNAVKNAVDKANNSGSDYLYTTGSAGAGGNFVQQSTIGKFNYVIEANKINYNTWRVNTWIFVSVKNF